MKEKNLLVITGPTAVGKTDFTLKIALKNNLEVVSCDSRQFYKEMEIGTAKPSLTELKQVKHHFINSLSITQDYSAGDFERDGLLLLDQLFKEHDRVILSGGSGLYIKALCEGLDSFPKVSKEVFEDVSSLSLEELQKELASADPAYHNTVDLANRHRLIRAVSVIRVSGASYSSFLGKNEAKRDFSLNYVILNRDREELYHRINMRVDNMIHVGLIEEAKGLYPYRNSKALQTVGYQELFSYFDGNIDLDSAIELIKRNSRRYAKRQLTWFRKIPNAHWLHPSADLDLKDL